MDQTFWHVLLLASAAVAAIACAATWLALQALTRIGIYDRPNRRSSHDRPKPRGGGLALLPVIVLAWLAADAWLAPASPGFWPALLGALLLGTVSWIDDLRGLPPAWRLVVQVLAVAFGVYGIGGSGLVFQGLLPPLLDHLGAALLWLWFVNLFNFMDGIDGISGVEAAVIGGGLVLVGALAPLSPGLVACAALLAAAALGFLTWNWAPSKLFLGDVGSVPLGYLLGWLLLAAALEGQWAAALVLPAYYLADATLTLARRARRGAVLWQAHREHFYQRAVQGGASHAAVASRVLVCGGVLVAFAAVAAGGRPWIALGGGGLAVALLLFDFVRLARRQGA